MSHRADHTLRRAARQLRIGIEREDVTDVGQPGEIAGLDRKRIEDLAKHLVQIEQLAAFALPTHPRSFARVVDAMTMEQVKASIGLACILPIEFVDKTDGEIHARIVLAHRFGRIGQICQQSEANVAIVIDEVTDFEIVHQATDLLFVEQQGRDGDHVGAAWIDALREIELRQNSWGQNRRNEIIHQLDGGLRSGQNQQNGAGDHTEPGVGADDAHDQGDDGDERDEFDSDDVDFVRIAPEESLYVGADRGAIPDPVQQLLTADVVYQVIAEVPEAVAQRLRSGPLNFGFLGHGDGQAGQLDLAHIGASRDLRDSLAIVFAADEIHAAINAGGIEKQDTVNDGKLLERLFPIDLADKTQTLDETSDIVRGGFESLGSKCVICPAAAVGNGFEKRQFDSRKQSREFGKAQRLGFLDSFEKYRKRGLGEAVIGGGEKRSCQHDATRNGFFVRGAD